MAKLFLGQGSGIYELDTHTTQTTHPAVACKIGGITYYLPMQTTFPGPLKMKYRGTTYYVGAMRDRIEVRTIVNGSDCGIRITQYPGVYGPWVETINDLHVFFVAKVGGGVQHVNIGNEYFSGNAYTPQVQEYWYYDLLDDVEMIYVVQPEMGMVWQYSVDLTKRVDSAYMIYEEDGGYDALSAGQGFIPRSSNMSFTVTISTNPQASLVNGLPKLNFSTTIKDSVGIMGYIEGTLSLAAWGSASGNYAYSASTGPGHSCILDMRSEIPYPRAYNAHLWLTPPLLSQSAMGALFEPVGLPAQMNTGRIDYGLYASSSNFKLMFAGAQIDLGSCEARQWEYDGRDYAMVYLPSILWYW